MSMAPPYIKHFEFPPPDIETNTRLEDCGTRFTYRSGAVALKRAVLNHKCGRSKRIDCSAVLKQVDVPPPHIHREDKELKDISKTFHISI